MSLIRKKTDYLGAEKISTMHLVVPSLREITKHLETEGKKQISKKFAVDLKDNIAKYFLFVTDPFHMGFDAIYLSATYLSPIHLQLLNDDERGTVERHLMVLMDDYNENEETNGEDITDVHCAGARTRA